MKKKTKKGGACPKCEQMAARIVVLEAAVESLEKTAEMLLASFHQATEEVKNLEASGKKDRATAWSIIENQDREIDGLKLTLKGIVNVAGAAMNRRQV